MGTGVTEYRISPVRLRFELARRGHRLGDLTQPPHPVSWATLSRLSRGVAIRRDSALRIARKLKGWPVNPELDQILQLPAEGRGSVPVPIGLMEPFPRRAATPVHRADPPGRDALPAGGDGAKQAPPGSAPNLNLHLSDDGEGAGPPSPNSAPTPATMHGASPAGGALCGGPVEGRGHGAAGEPRTGLIEPPETPAPSTDLHRPLRLLVAPHGKPVYKHDGQPHAGMRWVVALNGHPGSCSPDHRHSSPEAASDCFGGRS